MWQTEYTVGTLNVDMTIIILINFFIYHFKDTKSSFKYKKNNLSILTKLKKKRKKLIKTKNHIN